MRNRLQEIYDKLYVSFGPQHWWPGETPFEVAVGAILTQNTNWGNVEKAIYNLKKARKLDPVALHRLSNGKLAALIKPAGYYNIKAKRLKNFMDFFIGEYGGSIKKMKSEEIAAIREKLLMVNGIGPETADSIVLYALDMPTFVIDAYTKRILSRHKIMRHEASYDEYQQLFHEHFHNDTALFNEYHALLVRLAKDFCKTQPICSGCPIEGI